jgi:hypothetical protein
MPFSTRLLESRAGHLQVWDWPLPSKRYVIGADVAEGKVKDKAFTRRAASQFKDRPDFSAAIVLEIESGEHIASWHGYESTAIFAQALYAIGMKYNQALLVPEMNGPGIAVVEALVRSFAYPNLYVQKLFGRAQQLTQTENLEFGFRTSGASRALLVHRIHDALNDRTFRTRDAALVKELSTLQFDDNGNPRAKGVDKDDRVMALGLALQGRYEALVRLHEEPTEAAAPRGPDAWIWDRVKRMMDKTQRPGRKWTRTLTR